ncbi:MAG: hypothetical protein GXO14_00720 [Thermococci archaeon]|nr:hypothetical protein [Thermococci archaeon]
MGNVNLTYINVNSNATGVEMTLRTVLHNPTGRDIRISSISCSMFSNGTEIGKTTVPRTLLPAHGSKPL